MASKTQSTNVTQQKKVYVKSENAFKQMKANGQLEPNTEYYTPDDGDAVFMPVGAIFSSAIPQTDARVHLLDGSIISQTGIYADFAILLKTLVSSGYNITFSSNAEYENQIETYGQCGRFVIDDNAGTIRLPTITKFVEGLTDLTNIGKSFYAGLPNITGEWKAERSEVVTVLSTGAFSGTATYNSGSQPYYEKGNGGTDLKFNASASNPIYGKSYTVQPQSTAYPYYIVLAGGYKSNEQVNIDEIATEVNLKADKTLSNVSYPQNVAGSTTMGSGDRVVETYISSDGNTWYRKWASGWKECGVGNIKITINGWATYNLPLTFSNSNYTLLTEWFNGDENIDSNFGGFKIATKNINSFRAKIIYAGSGAGTMDRGYGMFYACGY